MIGPGTPLRLVVPEARPLDLGAGARIKVPIVYEDEDLLIVDKPAGLVVHPSPGHAAGTLVNALLGPAAARSSAASPASSGPGSSIGWTATPAAC